MVTQPALSDAEARLVLELLESERRNLPSEIHRSHMNAEYHERLQARLKLVDGLLAKLQHGPVQ